MHHLEYAVLLAMKKFGKYVKNSDVKNETQVGPSPSTSPSAQPYNNKQTNSKENGSIHDFDNVAKEVDKWSFLACSTFIIVFTVAYILSTLTVTC